MSNTTTLRTTSALLLLAALAACGENDPAEVRTDGAEFPVSASWTASAAPVGASPVSASLRLQQRLGFRVDATLTFTGAPNTTYQWRIYRGDCTTTTAASNVTVPGLFLFSTTESYPNVTTNASGQATVATRLAGALDSLTAYSVRVRPTQSATNWNGTNPVACGNLQLSAARR